VGESECTGRLGLAGRPQPQNNGNWLWAVERNDMRGLGRKRSWIIWRFHSSIGMDRMKRKKKKIMIKLSL
jgi:hypothetical protein